jgi:methylated-DNA-protein-cysteine methyltransferase related protein
MKTKKTKESYWEDVYAVTRLVPFGRVTTYGAIAQYLQLGSPRMVGWALNNIFTDKAVPAHRVVNRNGELTGRNHFATPTMMQELLEAEAISIENHKVKNFDTLLWLPLSELGEDIDLD